MSFKFYGSPSECFHNNPQKQKDFSLLVALEKEQGFTEISKNESSGQYESLY